MEVGLGGVRWVFGIDEFWEVVGEDRWYKVLLVIVRWVVIVGCFLMGERGFD